MHLLSPALSIFRIRVIWWAFGHEYPGRRIVRRIPLLPGRGTCDQIPPTSSHRFLSQSALFIASIKALIFGSVGIFLAALKASFEIWGWRKRCGWDNDNITEGCCASNICRPRFQHCDMSCGGATISECHERRRGHRGTISSQTLLPCNLGPDPGAFLHPPGIAGGKRAIKDLLRERGSGGTSAQHQTSHNYARNDQELHSSTITDTGRRSNMERVWSIPACLRDLLSTGCIPLKHMQGLGPVMAATSIGLKSSLKSHEVAS